MSKKYDGKNKQDEFKNSINSLLSIKGKNIEDLKNGELKLFLTAIGNLLGIVDSKGVIK